jgi:hypothetical protein
MIEAINLKKVCELAEVPHHKVYFWAIGRYEKGPNRQLKTQLANAVVDGIKPFLAKLGYDVTIRKRA